MLLLFFSSSFSAFSKNTDSEEPKSLFPSYKIHPVDTPPPGLPFPFEEDQADDGEIYLGNPDNVTEEVIFDEETGGYIILKKVGDIELSRYTLTADEYRERQERRMLENYWKQQERARSQGKDLNSLIPQLNVGGDVFRNIFGSNVIDIRPQGSVELILGGQFNRNDNPSIPERQRRVGAFVFKQNIQLNVLGKIGEKINMNINYNTQAMFNFDQRLNLRYEGEEDDILKLIEAGNVVLPLTGSLITGSTSLFGIKTALQFGRLTVTSVYSQQQGERSEITVQGGAQVQQFEIIGSNYEDNRHYFLAEYFKQNFDNAMRNLPLINSAVNITRIEVWVTNRINAVENVRNITAVMALGENFPNIAAPNAPFPRNELNQFNPLNWDQTARNNINSPLFTQLNNGITVEYLNNARLLNPNEYTFNPLLGFISLNQPLNTDEVLGVAFQYVANGQLFQVGEFSTDVLTPNTIMVKLLKSTILDVTQPNWDWMMKNIYNLGGFQISRENFMLNILYRDIERGTLINFIPDPAAPAGVGNTPLLRVFNLDRLNPNNDQQPDGFFDYIEGITINSQTGRVMFPVREPFGSFLRQKLVSPTLGDRYAFDTLYAVQRQIAELDAEKNRYYLAGQFKSAGGGDIALNAMNIAPGSVTVTAGGRVLTENVDYTVDYTMGRVRILNEGLMNSGTPIKVSLENRSLFAIQQRRLVGTHLDYRVSDNLMFGGTIMNLTERPFTQKINIGEEPISNTIWGIDGTYTANAPWLTRLVDKIPLINTKTPSKINMMGEFAHIIPGYSKDIGRPGISQIDDFEGAETSIDIRNFTLWRLGSAPQRQPGLFPHAEKFNNLEYGYNRALLSWYQLDPIFFRQNNLTPRHIFNNPELRSNHYTREVLQVEVFPNLQLPPGQQPNLPVLDIAFYPKIRGPYNLDVNSIGQDGLLVNPKQSYGSMMRRVETTDWEAANIDYLEFWLMDPFNEDLNQLKVFETGNTAAKNENFELGGGELLIHLGNISEDVLLDGRMSFENGLPTDQNNLTAVVTAWGKTPGEQIINQNFDNDPASRAQQDVGLDGMNDEEERQHFAQFVNAVNNSSLPQNIKDQLLADPAADNYKHYNGSAYNNDVGGPGHAIHERYKFFQRPEGNSPVGNINEAQSQFPNSEDINNDNTLNQSENYFQYRIRLRNKNDLALGQNFVTDTFQTQVPTPNGQIKTITWYQFRVPVRTADKEAYGQIQDFRSIRFMRLCLTGFSDDIFLRFARFELVRANWRQYPESITDPEVLGTPSEQESFSVTTVNIEENSQKRPFNYVLPPGVTREIDPANPQLQQLNEQSLVLNFCNLNDGFGRAVFKNVDLDLRAYKKLQMFIHLEDQEDLLRRGDVTAFIRFGADLSQNYYEYEISLTPSDQSLSAQDPNNVWPTENKMDFELALFSELKRERNRSGAPTNFPYREILNNARVTVVGNPNLRDIKIIMLGVRNPHKALNPFQSGNSNADDGLPKCGQIWMNELRVVDYFEPGGWAANTRVSANLADLGQINAALGTERAGFGSIDKKPLERARYNTTTFDLSTSFELAKFTPQKWGLSIPFFYGYSSLVANPQFNPLDPDILFRDALSDKQSDNARDSLKRVTQTVITQTGYNFTNVRKNRTNSSKKPMPWDIENLDLTFARNEIRERSMELEFNNTTTTRGILGYTYNPTPKYIEPFKGIKNKSKYLKPIKDFNFTPTPKQFAFRSDIQRNFNEMLFRNTTEYDLLIEPTFRKDFVWFRTYDFNYTPTRSINITFNAMNNARVDEPDGRIDTQEKRDSVRNNFWRFGRNIDYQHNYNITYNIPLNKFPLTDWLNVNAGYGGAFQWMTGPLLLRDDGSGEFFKPWGNTIQNSNTKNVNAQANMNTLYNKVPFIKKINTPQRPGGNRPQPGRPPTPPVKPNTDPKNDDTKVKTKTFVQEKVFLKKGKAKTFKHKLKTENVKVIAVDEDGKPVDGKTEVIDKNRLRFIPNIDSKRSTITIEGKIEKKDIDISKEIIKAVVKIGTSLKNVNMTFTENNGTALPGYNLETEFLGQIRTERGLAPGLPFAFGQQKPNNEFARDIATNGWLTRDTTLNTMFMRTKTQNINVSGNLEPFRGFRINLTANRNLTRSAQEFYRFNQTLDDFQSQSFMEMGNFTMSYNAFRTSFVNDNPNFSSRLFRTMLEYREIFSNTLADQRPDANQIGTNPNGFRDGYGESQQDVLIYSFLAAYTGRTPDQQKLTLFPSMPSLNWRATFDGLKNIPFFKKRFKNVVIGHGYRSTLTVNSFMNNQLWQPLAPDLQGFDFTNEKDEFGNFVARFLVQNVSIMESFSPLFDVDLSWKNGIITKFEVKRSRNIGINIQNNQLTEMKTQEYVLGAGYTLKQFRLPFIVAGKRLENDLMIRLDVGLRDNRTVIRRILEEIEQITAGQQNLTIKFFADYAVTQTVNVRFFYDRLSNNPFVANQFPTVNTNTGISVRFTLAP